MKDKKQISKARSFSLNIILGVFIAIMITVLFNLLVSYVYEAPEYNAFCDERTNSPYPVKYGDYGSIGVNCTFSKPLQEQTDACYSQEGMPIYEYDNNGCTIAIKECSMCNKEFNDATEKYNRISFFIYAAIGFALIVIGLFVTPLIVQISALPAGAFLVIEAAVKNFDDKLLVIITFALLIAAAIYLALKKLR